MGKEKDKKNRFEECQVTPLDQTEQPTPNGKKKTKSDSIFDLDALNLSEEMAYHFESNEQVKSMVNAKNIRSRIVKWKGTNDSAKHLIGFSIFAVGILYAILQGMGKATPLMKIAFMTSTIAFFLSMTLSFILIMLSNWLIFFAERSQKINIVFKTPYQWIRMFNYPVFMIAFGSFAYLAIATARIVLWK